MTEKELQEKELMEAQEYLMAELANRGVTQALPEVETKPEEKEEKGNFFKRGLKKVTEKAKSFGQKHPGLVKAAGKSVALVIGLQVARWVCQRFF